MRQFVITVLASIITIFIITSTIKLIIIFIKVTLVTIIFIGHSPSSIHHRFIINFTKLLLILALVHQNHQVMSLFITTPLKVFIFIIATIKITATIMFVVNYWVLLSKFLLVHLV